MSGFCGNTRFEFFVLFLHLYLDLDLDRIDKLLLMYSSLKLSQTTSPLEGSTAICKNSLNQEVLFKLIFVLYCVNVYLINAIFLPYQTGLSEQN